MLHIRSKGLLRAPSGKLHLCGSQATDGEVHGKTANGIWPSMSTLILMIVGSMMIGSIMWNRMQSRSSDLTKDPTYQLGSHIILVVHTIVSSAIWHELTFHSVGSLSYVGVAWHCMVMVPFIRYFAGHVEHMVES